MTDAAGPPPEGEGPSAPTAGAPVPGWSEDASLAHVLGRLAVVEARAAALVAARERGDEAPSGRYRGIVVTPGDVEAVLRRRPSRPPPLDPAAELLVQVEQAATDAVAAGGQLALADLAGAFGLSALELDVLVVAMAPDLDARFETLFCYLQDNVSLNRATVGLALELAGRSPVDAQARRCLTEGGPLVAAGLVEVRDPERPFLSRTLTVPDAVVAHLLGDPRPDPLVERLEVVPSPCLVGDPEAIARALRAGGRVVYLRERHGSSAWSLGAAAVATLGLDALTVDLGRVGDDDLRPVLRRLVRAAKLTRRLLVAGPVDHLSASDLDHLLDPEWPVLLTGRGPWGGRNGPAPLEVVVPAASSAARASLWRALLGSDVDADLEVVTAPYTFSPERIPDAVDLAAVHAAYEDRELSDAHIQAGARSQGSSTLERLARRVRPSVGWKDLVVPDQLLDQLQRLAARARHRNLVLEEWGLRPGSRGRGVIALFAGPSGTGKTLSAEVMAADLGLDLFAVDLATVVDKYIGETEKNLEKVFDEAEGSDVVLFFDEADALFGKRSEVSDARDRYANLEVAYLLQRLEAFSGVAVLSTNLATNMDEAFSRRLDDVVTFRLPNEEERRRLWDLCLGSTVERAADVDLGYLARSFELTGGAIRNCATTAAYGAAQFGPPLVMEDLVTAVVYEYRKMGRLCTQAEFGEWFPLVQEVNR